MANRDPTPAELAIQQLKEAVKDLVEVRKDFEDDLFLLRWLKARNMDVKKAEKMARGWHHWWVNDVEKLLPLNIDPELAEAMCKYTPKVICRNGAIMDIVQSGYIDLHLLLTKFDKEQISRYFLEELINAEKQHILGNQRVFDENPCKVITEDSLVGNIAVFDLKDLSLKQVTSFKCFQMIMKTARMMSNYFPSMASKCIVINCPAFVGFMVKIVRPIIAMTNVSLECYDDNEEIWKEVLLRHVHPDELLTSYGGNKDISSFTKYRY